MALTECVSGAWRAHAFESNVVTPGLPPGRCVGLKLTLQGGPVITV